MLGETNSVSNFWVGPDWNNNYMTWDSSAIKSNRPHVSQNGYHWLQKELPQFSFGAGGVTDEYLVLAKIFDNAGNVASSGVMGEIIAARGGTSTGNSSCKTRIHVTCAYNNNYCGEFTTTGSRDFYKISIITIDGVKYYAAKAREGGGDSHLGISFSGWIITDNASNLLTRVRTSDAGVAFVSDVFYPTQARTTSDNTLRLETNGSDRLVIASNGYVGIGNPDPKSILHISNGHGAGSSGILNLTPNGSGGSASLIVAGNNDSGGTPGPNVIAFANRTITFGGGDSFTSNTGGTITAWANVSASGLAIGSGFSTATAKLAVYGAVGDNNSSDATFLVSCASSNDWGQIIDKGASADYGLDIRVAPSAAYGFRVNSNFRVNGSGEVFSTNSYASGDVIIRGTDAAPRGLFIQEWDGATTYGGGISYDSVADQLYLFTRSASSTDLKALTISRGSNNVTILGTLTEASTRRIKKNIRPITNALEVVNKLQGVIYDKIDGSQKDEPGLIAEDTLDAIANLVVFDDDGQPAGVKYTKTVAYLIEAVKELTAKVNALENK
jgi:hypothetical protein